MKLFAKIKNGNKIIFSVCGIKFKYKIKNDDFLDNLFTEWQTDFQPLLLEQKLRTLLKCLSSQKNENKEIFLIFISTLIENNKTGEAKKILSEYIAKYGLEFISFYPLVADLAFKLNQYDAEIKKCALVWNKLENNRTNHSLEKYLRNKKIAIIGNSPNLLGKNKGPDIDKADVVVRFNNYSIQNFEKDYGRKTNIWVCCQAGDSVKKDMTKQLIKIAKQQNCDMFFMYYKHWQKHQNNWRYFPARLMHRLHFLHLEKAEQLLIYKALISGRFHACCMSLMLGIPTFAIESNTWKIKSMFEDAGILYLQPLSKPGRHMARLPI